MPRTPFDKVTPEYRSAVVPENHWMSVCHPYFIPNQPPPPPCGCCPPPPPVTPKPGCGAPLLDKAPVPCGFVEADPARPVISPLGHVVPGSPEAMPERPAEADTRNPVDYDGLRTAPHPYVDWLAKREVNVAAGDNVDVELSVDSRTGDKTYTVSSHTPEEEMERLARIERELAAQLEEVRRIKANMLSVSEDETEEGSNGIVFKEGME